MRHSRNSESEKLDSWNLNQDSAFLAGCWRFLVRLVPSPFFPLLTILGLLGLSSVEAQAQAPASIAGRAVILTISSGSGPFPSSGSYRFLGSATDDTYVEISLSGSTQDSDGTFTYSSSGAVGTVDFNDARLGNGYIATLNFSTSTSGSYVLSNPSVTGSQTGTFVIYNGQGPASVQGWTFQLQINDGISPFASSGTLQIIPAATGATYQIIGGPGVSNSHGTYTYALVSPSASSLVMDDSVLGSAYAQTFSWNTTTTGAFIARNAAGDFQAGTFVATPPSYTVTPGSGANGSINPNTPQTVTSGGSVRFTATPNVAYGVYQWLLNGLVVQTGGTSYTTSAITANSTVEVTFEVVPVISSATTASGAYHTLFGGYAITASGSPTTYAVTGDLPPGLTLNTATGLISGTPTEIGTFNVTLGATNPAGTGNAPLAITINQANQTINFPAIATQAYPAAPITLSATASSALAVSFSLVSGPATLSGGILTLTGTGTVMVQASQPGDTNYLPATSVTQSFIVAAPVIFTGDPAATPENDGVPNLLKYLADINPAQPMTPADWAALPTAGTTTIAGAPVLTLTYRQYALETGLILTVQTSNDLQTWTAVSNPTVVQTGADPNTGDPIMQIQVSVTGTREFARLVVTQP